MDSYTDKSLLEEVARLYYDYQISQQQIADRVGTSRPSISRLRQQAWYEGIVRIDIIDTTQQGSQLEYALKEQFSLKKSIIVPSEKESDQEIKKVWRILMLRPLYHFIFLDWNIDKLFV